MDDQKYIFGNNRLVVGVACSPGGCSYMQDSFLVHLDANVTKSLPDIFGVCDGHGQNGDKVSTYICENISKVISQCANGKPVTAITDCLEEACIIMDQRLLHANSLKNKDGTVYGGSTCNIVLVGQQDIYCCNVGDSRAILSFGGRARALSGDHKPDRFKERMRIQNVGGFVKNGRVNGELGVSRAFGDFSYKQNTHSAESFQLVTCIPDVSVTPRNTNIDFIVIASDGVWDMMSNQEVVDYILTGMKEGKPLDDICLQLVKNCFVPTLFAMGSDNATVMVAKLL